MPEYILSFRVHGPSQFSEGGNIGGATVRPMSNNSGVTATIDFTVEASDLEQAKGLAEEYRDRARTILDVLSFVVEDGLVLGKLYDPIPADANIQQRRDITTSVNELVIDIGDGILDTADDALTESPRTRRSLTWYNLGLSTETAEDRFIAFWTGLEASVETKSGLTDEQDELYDEVVEVVEEVLSENPDFRNRVKSVLGMVQRESAVGALKRALSTEAGYDVDDLDSLGEISKARANVVHRGESVEDATEKAQNARKLLQDLLDSRLSHSYQDLLEGGTELPADRDRPYHISIDADEWINLVFEDDPGRTLEVREIQRRSYPLFQDIHEVARLSVVLPNLSGWGDPLYQVDQENYRYSPPPEWLTPQIDAVLRYLNGAGWVPPSVIQYNAPSERTDIDEIGDDDVRDICEHLVERRLVDQDGEYFKITLDGEMCLDGRIDPREMVKQTE